MKKPRVVLDTNIYISALIGSKPAGVVAQVMSAVFEGAFQVAMPSEQLDELRGAVEAKPHLQSVIAAESLDLFISALLEIGELLPPLTGEIPRRFRDQRDDYLMATAIQNDIDLIVSGDRDLLDVREEYTMPRIVSLHELLAMIGSTH